MDRQLIWEIRVARNAEISRTGQSRQTQTTTTTLGPCGHDTLLALASSDSLIWQANEQFCSLFFFCLLSRQFFFSVTEDRTRPSTQRGTTASLRQFYQYLWRCFSPVSYRFGVVFPLYQQDLIDLERVESLGSCNTAGLGTWDIGFCLGGITVFGLFSDRGDPVYAPRSLNFLISIDIVYISIDT